MLARAIGANEVSKEVEKTDQAPLDQYIYLRKLLIGNLEPLLPFSFCLI